ncbi:M56 family metallopeptidase [Chamaesiphon sp. OTE_75_metabat_556]|uniref:M56 family metallopeptidase n=1 Tax=Chamaesiphon sp. OTE_75_metabat_556 TaxID=2964692 RepID=UPI00286A32D4|nr:M56 family metallopeptidase [Chamaesiphon sp. OTE_75_metabat_556]
MHLIVLTAILTIVWLLRCTWSATDRHNCVGQTTLVIFLLPPLSLFTSAISIIWMGPHGRMVWVGNDWLSYALAIGFLGYAVINLLDLASSGWRMLHQIRTYSIVTLGASNVRLLDIATPHSAQIGFWEPELVITQGLLDTLTTEQLAAVLAHEQAHYHYRDTWCFFWLGWLRQMTAWLPQTEAIWQQLIILRELRADRWAADRTDPLVVATALLAIVQNTPVFTENICAAFSQAVSPDRLTQRIDALLDRVTTHPETDTDVEPRHYISAWAWLLVAVLPLLTIPFHS